MAKKRGWAHSQLSNRRFRDANIYGALAANPELHGYASGDMNAHLTERLGATSHGEHHYPDPEITPLAKPSRINNDIGTYYEDARKPVVNAGAWFNKPEMPTPAELLANCPTGFTIGEKIIDLTEDIRPNKTEGPYKSSEEYLGTQYELLREDALRPLRRAVEEVRKDPWKNESDYPSSVGIGIYEPVYLKAVQFSFRGLSTKMAFSLSRVKKLIRWRQSKRLITGTLVALSPADDAFQDPSKVLLATVGARPISALESNNPPEIDLFFVCPENYDFDPARKWIMVESRTSFFEASRHTLLALQHMMHEPFPLSGHLVKVQKDIKPPEYVRLNPDTDLGSLVSLDEAERFKNVNILQEWPQGDSLTLDASQSKALRRMLTKQLAIVQGPPGTGKTYVSVIALKILLANMRRGDPPIIVACQTNHALDQILQHVAEFETNFVRLGGQTKDQDVIKKRTLYEVRGLFERPQNANSRKLRAMGTMRLLTKKMQMLLAPFERGQSPLSHRLLAELELITQKQADSLEIDAPYAMGIPQDSPGVQMEQWLGRCLESCERPYQPDDFGMPYEEEDFDEVEDLQEIEREAVARDDDEDIETLKGPLLALSDNHRGKIGGKLRSDADIRAKLEEVDDLATIEIQSRGVIYNYLLRKAKQKVMENFGRLAKQYAEQVHERKLGQWEDDQAILMGQRVIGMTTTGLSKYRALVSSLRPRVVLVEEAAETLEAPVTAACLPTLEHLILVGDHKQLRPHCNLHEFEDEPYNFNLSLFERMAENDVELSTLKRQRRMIPEIRRLLFPIYGSSLKDHPSVEFQNNRPPVEGMGGTNSFFFTHEWPESRDNNQSVKNEAEADMIVGFIDYLVLNGLDPSKITVLTFYNGQRKLLTGKVRRHHNLNGHDMKIVTVDSYQGEENDVIVLSLVRSSRDGSIGFLSVQNRICVALSRAKRGLYLFGNAEQLVCASDTWEMVAKTMWGHANKSEIPQTGPRTRIGYMLPLTCVRHGNKSFIQTPDDWELANGGCAKKCRCVLPCGHQCMLRCHPFENDRINCMQRCGKPCSTCARPCNEICSEPCKCSHCDRRSGGRKPMVKSVQAATYSVQPSVSNNLIRTHPAFPAAATPIQEARPMPKAWPEPEAWSKPEAVKVHECSGSNPEMWQTYATGGVKADDAQAMEKTQEEAAKFQELVSNGSSASSGTLGTSKLIQVSPKKNDSKTAPANTGLLVDLAEDSVSPLLPPSPHTLRKGKHLSYKERFSYIGEMTSALSMEGNTAPSSTGVEQKIQVPVMNLLD